MGASRAAAASSEAPPAEAAALRWLETLGGLDWIMDVEDPALLVLVLRELAETVTHRVHQRLNMLLVERRTAPVASAPVDRWLRIEDVAALLGVSVSHIRHLPPDAIPGRRQLVAGGRVVWSEQAVRRFVESAPAKS